MDQLVAQQQEIEALKSQLKAKDAQIASLEKLNGWYLEQLKLRRQKQFGASSENVQKISLLLATFLRTYLMKLNHYVNHLPQNLKHVK